VNEHLRQRDHRRYDAQLATVHHLKEGAYKMQVRGILLDEVDERRGIQTHNLSGKGI
jgi:hypothetical protein